MLPMFDINFKTIKDDFCNCYLSYNNFEYDFPVIFLVLKTRIPIINSYFIEEHEDLENYIYVLKIPDNFQEDYEKLLQGKYSKVSKLLLDNITKMWGFNSQPVKVIKKEESRKKWLEEYIGQKLPEDAELMSVFDLENQEILKTKELKLC